MLMLRGQECADWLARCQLSQKTVGVQMRGSGRRGDRGARTGEIQERREERKKRKKEKAQGKYGCNEKNKSVILD